MSRLGVGINPRPFLLSLLFALADLPSTIIPPYYIYFRDKVLSPSCVTAYTRYVLTSQSTSYFRRYVTRIDFLPFCILFHNDLSLTETPVSMLCSAPMLEFITTYFE